MSQRRVRRLPLCLSLRGAGRRAQPARRRRARERNSRLSAEPKGAAPATAPCTNRPTPLRDGGKNERWLRPVLDRHQSAFAGQEACLRLSFLPSSVFRPAAAYSTHL